MDKKTWTKPELISLTRCGPEEAVLAACKYGSTLSDPVTVCVGCVGQVASYVCFECDQYTAS